MSLTRGLGVFVEGNEEAERTLRGVSGAVSLAVGALQTYEAISAITAKVDFSRAAAGVAAHLESAPVIAAVVAGSVAAVLAAAHFAGAFGEGGSFVTAAPTFFLAGERGPERITVTPLRGGPAGGGPSGPGTVNITVLSNDERVIGDAWTRRVVHLQEAGW
jgi:hypothetical protein